VTELTPYTKSNNISFKTSVDFCLRKIQSNNHLNAFVNVYEKEARKKAIEIDSSSDPKAKKLAGMIVGLKDMFCYKDHPLSSGSKILEGFISQITATSVQKLIDNDCIIIGHQNCDQFGMGSSNENSYYGAVRNPIDETRVPGGSSGGSAAAVKSGMCHVALGTDTGGSVRQPASFCGIVGFKPTYSRISRFGVIAYASSFDTVGILSQNIDDCAAVLESIAGHDPLDNTSSRKEVPKYTQNLRLDKNYKIAYLNETINHEGLQKEIKDNILKTISKLKTDGHKVKGVEFPLLNYTLPTYYILTTAEASANLARYDGVRYGYRSEKSSDIDNMYKYTRTEGFGEEVKRRILLGTAILSSGYHDAYYTKAQRVRALIRKKFDEIMAKYDFIILPTTPTTAFKINSNKDPISMYLSDLYTVQASAVGYPAISIPNGEDAEGLPIGIQIIGAPYEEAKLLAFAKYVFEINN